MTPADQGEFWKRLIIALGAEPRDATTIRGVSGIDHKILGLGVDDKRNRIVLISADNDPRVAALMQVDVQATISGSRVLVARPIVFGLPMLAKAIIDTFGTPEVDIKRLVGLSEPGGVPGTGLIKLVNPILAAGKLAYENVPLDMLAQVLNVVKQFTLIEVQKAVETTPDNLVLNFSKLASSDLNELDRELGVCAIPIYQFGDEDWKIFLDGNTSDVENHLKSIGVFQYFFPPPDHAALGLVDRGVKSQGDLIKHVDTLTNLGHPQGDPEIVSTRKLADMVDALRDRDLVVEGEFGLEVSESGKTIRSTVRFKPREGALSKVLNKLSLTLNVNNTFK